MTVPSGYVVLRVAWCAPLMIGKTVNLLYGVFSLILIVLDEHIKTTKIVTTYISPIWCSSVLLGNCLMLKLVCSNLREQVYR